MLKRGDVALAALDARAQVVLRAKHARHLAHGAGEVSDGGRGPDLVAASHPGSSRWNDTPPRSSA